MKKNFSWALMSCFAIPLVFLIINPYFHGTTNFINLLVTIAGLHVFATVYLLSDRNILILFAKFKAKLILIPGLFVFFSVILFGTENSKFFTEAFLAFIFYQTWHFGAQNMGVSTFISISTNSEKLTLFEKNLIKAGILSGILGVPYAMSPDFLIGSHYLNINNFEKLFVNLNKIGYLLAMIICLISLPTAMRRVFKNNVFLGVSLFFSINFYLPIYLFKNPFTGIIFVLIAHGTQYLSFLIFHLINRKEIFNSKFTARLLTPTIFLSIILIAYILWKDLPSFGTPFLPNFGLSIIVGLTLAHFWIDHFIWKMKDVQQRNWISSSYSFIFNKP